MPYRSQQLHTVTVLDLSADLQAGLIPALVYSARIYVCVTCEIKPYEDYGGVCNT